MALYNMKYDKTKRSKGRLKEEIVCKLEEIGYEKYIKWNEYVFNVSIALGVVLSIEGVITDDEIIINSCSGAFSDKVLEQIKIMVK